MNEETFKVRAYGYGELAQLYFPNVTNRSATIQFRKWIMTNKKLKKELEDNFYKPGQRLLTPLQVKIIIECLGEP